ncbi:DUF1449 domain-containing protein [Veronia nyctiphanis]|uniref:DUF1449 domain-containing protein n=1 Tax=Veronia nyctiphanis TaxID=1278244 RepID=A0A4Q0YPQ7_9GAMM|nr:DUF1449 family protein [Veronia nyctiphanis]RXJ73027.1 DUF1449 domain-containing protein [Veronia nyctiphanis]
MALGDFFTALLSFPISIFFVPFTVLALLMIIDQLFNVVDGLTSDLDLFDFDQIPGTGLLLPPILSKVPLTVALCVSFFLATVLSFYLSQFTGSALSGSLKLVLDIAMIPVIAYVSLALAAWLLKPLAPLFDKQKAFANVDFIGLRARVHSSKVCDEAGEVVVLHEGNEFLLDAARQGDTQLEYGDEVIIVSKDSTTSRYWVAKA